MPTLVTGGPDIPAAVLQALEDGELVLFCGAGVSMPAGLKNFRDLVKQIYEALGEEESPAESIAIEDGQLDRALGLLEKRIAPGEVRRKVRECLTLSESADLSLHKAILYLARSRDGLLRLVTTNFDNAFALAGCPEEEIDTAPMLPIPKPPTWGSLVHLHGRTYSRDPNGNNLVLTSADFGNAYLAEGWASRFVTELFRHFTVLFVGYSVDDPVIRYLTDAISAERARGLPFRTPYAFAGIEGRRHARERLTTQWSAKSVEPIIYEARNKHIKLQQTLETMVEMHRLGFHSKHHILHRHAQEAPLDGILDDVARRVVWALSDPTGVAAAEFAKIDPAPPLRWLKVFEHPDFTNYRLLSSTEGGAELTIPLVDNGSRSNLPSDPSRVTLKLGDWLCRHLSDPELLEWVLRKGGRPHPAFRRAIRKHLREHDVPAPLRTAWEILSSEIIAEARSRHLHQWTHSFLGLLEYPPAQVTRYEIRSLLTPVPRLRARVAEEKEFLSFRGSDGQKLHDLIEVDVDLAGGQRAHHFVTFELARAQHRDDILAALAADLTSLLLEAMDWFTTIGGGHQAIPSVASLPRTTGYDSWPLLVYLTWDSFRVASQRDELLMHALLARWNSVDYLLFRRLSLQAAVEIPTLKASPFVDLLLRDNARVLWASLTEKEVLQFLESRGNSIPLKVLNPLAKRIRRGPDWERPTHWSDDQWQWNFERAIWTRLAALRQSGATLPQPILDWLDATQKAQQFPPREREEAIDWISHDIYLSKYSADEIDSFTKDELIELLLEQDGRSGLLQDWRHLVQRHPSRGACVLREMARRQEWPSDVWETALFGFRDSQASLFHSPTWIWHLLSHAPETLFAKIPRTIAQWLRDQSKTLRPRCKALYWKIFDSIWQFALSQTATINDPINTAINHPAGILAELLISRLAESKPQASEELPAELAQYFDEIVSENSEGHLLARVILATQLNFLHTIDPSWTKAHLINRLDWKHSLEARTLWTAYLWQPRANPDLFREIKSLLFQSLDHLDDLGRGGTNLVRLITFASLEIPDSVSLTEKRRFVRTLSPKQLAEVGDALRDLLKSAGEQRAQLWKERLAPWFQETWPGHLGTKSPEVSHSLALLAIATGEALPHALEILHNKLAPVQDLLGILFTLEEADFPERYPRQTLILIDALLPHDDPRRTYGHRSDLKELLDRLKNTRPEIVEEPAYRRVEEFLAQLEL